MNDGIIKADGTSRLMRAELPATYEEFRTQAAAGTLPMDILFNADGWTQLPTFLNKGALLKDLTAALYGLGVDAVPDEVLQFLGKYNLHWWRRRSTETRSEYVERKTLVTTRMTVTPGADRVIQYSAGISIDQSTGVVSLVDPQELTANHYGHQPPFYPVYFQNISDDPDSVFFAEDDGTALFIAPGDSSSMVWINANRCYEITTDVVDIPIGATDYVHSSDRSAYPDSGTSDGYEYAYLGVPFENAVTAPKIAAGSYVGTGTYGQSNPTTLEFDAPPLIVFVVGGRSFFAIQGNPTANVIYGGSGGTLSLIWSGNSLSWYVYAEPDAYNQLNIEGKAYYYIALWV